MYYDCSQGISWIVSDRSIFPLVDTEELNQGNRNHDLSQVNSLQGYTTITTYMYE